MLSITDCFPFVLISKIDRSIIEYNDKFEKVWNDLSAISIRNIADFFLAKYNENISLIDTLSCIYYLEFIEDINNNDQICIILIDIRGILFKADNYLDVNSFQHEVRNPLSIINGASQLLLKKSVDGFVDKCANIILKESKRVENLMDDINSISSIKLNNSKFNVMQLIRDIIESLKVMFADISFILEFDPALDEIYGDRDKIFRALYNIVKNGCDVYKKGNIRIIGTIEPSVKLYHKEKNMLSSMVKISIIDNAGGIDGKVLSKIFSPFFSTKSKGSGLGLTVAKEIIEKHKGLIDIKINKNVGTTFNVLLPL